MSGILDKLSEIDTGQQLKIIDENGNSYEGTFEWDSEEETYFLDEEYRIVAEYDEREVFIVRPVEDDMISGFLARIVSFEIIGC